MAKKVTKRIKKQCPQCKGEGEIPLFRFFSKCPRCNGKGKIRILEVLEIEEPEDFVSSDTDEYGWVMFPDSED